MIIITILFLGIAAVAVFLVTFDIDKYKPLIVRKGEEATGKGISIDDVDLSFENGLGIRFTGLRIYDNPAKDGYPVMSVGSGDILINLLPLLKGSVVVNKLIFISPEITIIQDQKKAVSIGGFDLSEPEQAGPVKTPVRKKTAGQDPPMVFSVDLLEIKDGTVTIHDRTASPPVKLTINDIDVTIKDVSLSGPVRFDIRMGIFNTVQNIISSGTCVLSPDGTARLENSDLNIDLGRIKMSRVLNAFPALRRSGFSEDLSGKLALNVSTLFLDPAEISKTDSSLTLSGGRIKLDTVPSAFSDINMKAVVKNDTLSVSDASLKFAEGVISANGEVRGLTGSGLSSFEGDLKGLSLTELIPPPRDDAAYMSGIISSDIKGTARGFGWPAMAYTIKASGRLSLKDGVINNMNILKEVFRQISAIPGLVENLESRLSEEYKKELTKKDTVFYPVNIDISISNGTIFCDNINIRTDHLSIGGRVEVGMVDQALGGKLYLRIGPDLSGAFVKIVNELEHVQNSNKEIEIPVKIKGSITAIEIIPDLNYLAKKIIVTEVERNVRELLKEAFSKEEPAPQGQQTPQQEVQQQPQQQSGGRQPSSIVDLFREAIDEQLRQ